jgi:hypothetical protein
MPRSQSTIDRAVVACSMWLHVGYIGAVAAAAGLIQLLVREATWPSALVLVFSGGILAAACWRRARAVLEHAEPAPAVASGESARRATAQRMQRGTVVALSRPSRQASRKRRDQRRGAAPK